MVWVSLFSSVWAQLPGISSRPLLPDSDEGWSQVLDSYLGWWSSLRVVVQWQDEWAVQNWRKRSFDVVLGFFKCGADSLIMKHQWYASNLLHKHGMAECKAASTSLADKLELTKDQMPEEGSDEQQQLLRNDYRGLVGSIAYLSLSTRPDLTFPAHLLSRFLSNPGFAHWQAAKHGLRYLRGTTDVGITFMKCDDTGLNGYTDSSYTICKDDRRSITGFCFNVGSGEISWAARRQTYVATSTT